MIQSAVLQYYDGIAGTKLKDELENKRARIADVLTGGLAVYGLKISDSPKVLRARVMRPPVIQFSNREAEIRNGSFDLRNVTFERLVPALLSSHFASIVTPFSNFVL